MVALKPLFLLLALGGEAIAATNSVICATRLGTKSIASNKIPRATTTIKAQIFVIKRIIQKVDVIVVPRPRTTTSTSTVQTTVTVDADPDVETAITTVTDVKTTINVGVLITTTTSTSTSVTTRVTTSTVPAPAGFTPLGDTIQSQPDARKLRARAAREISALPNVKAGSIYFQRVDCTKRVPSTTIKTFTSTMLGSRATMRPTTKTIVTTKTETITTTNYPAAVTDTRTETVSSTITENSFATIWGTATSTVIIESIVPAAEPFYAACGDNNIKNRFSNGRHFGVATGSLPRNADIYNSGEFASAYECCVECMKKPSCLASTMDGQDTTCIHQRYTGDDNTCANGQNRWATLYYDDEADWTWSNGPCGLIKNEADF